MIHSVVAQKEKRPAPRGAPGRKLDIATKSAAVKRGEETGLRMLVGEER